MPLTERQAQQALAKLQSMPLAPRIDGQITDVRSVLYGMKLATEIFARVATLDPEPKEELATGPTPPAAENLPGAAADDPHDTSSGITVTTEPSPRPAKKLSKRKR